MVKNINFIGFALMQVICINVLSYLSTSNLDLTNELNFVSDSTMIGILELSMIVFTLWMGILILIHIINKLTRTVLSGEIIEEEQETVVEHTPVFAGITSTLSDKWNELKNQKPSLPEMKKPMLATEIMQPETIVEETVVEEESKMTPELLNRLLQPETNMSQMPEVKQTTTIKQPEISWSSAVIEALNIPTDPIINDTEEPFMNRLVETVPENKMVADEETHVSDKRDTSSVVDLCQLLLRKQEDSGHSLEDYLELKKYLVAKN
jgi:hypothetical protein